MSDLDRDIALVREALEEFAAMWKDEYDGTEAIAGLDDIEVAASAFARIVKAARE